MIEPTSGGGSGAGRPGPFRPGGRSPQPWVGGGDAPGPAWRDRIDFSRRGKRAQTDGSEAVTEGDGATDGGGRADPAGSGMRPMASDGGAGESAPVRVELFGRPGCHLCEEAKGVVERVVRETGAELIEHDISLDPALEAKYGEYIPVVLVEGRQHGQWRVDAGHLERAIRAARRGRVRPFGFRGRRR